MSHRVLAVDPGAKAGFAYFVDGVLENWGDDPESFTTTAAELYDELVIEAQYAATHIYRNGRRVRVSRASQQGLSFTAGRLFERFQATKKYRIGPDAWRAVLWPGLRRVPKRVVLARLEEIIDPGVWAGQTDDTREAIGIGMAWVTLTPAQKRKYVVRT